MLRWRIERDSRASHLYNVLDRLEQSTLPERAPPTHSGRSKTLHLGHNESRSEFMRSRRIETFCEAGDDGLLTRALQREAI